MYEYVFFDLDGTLTDSGEEIINAAVYALEKYNIEVNDRSELRKFIGPPLQDSFSTDYGFSEDEIEDVIKTFREYYSEKGIFENTIYENIQTVLFELKNRGKKLVVATSKPEVFTKKVLDHFNISSYFDYVSGATLNNEKIQKVDIIRDAICKLGITDKSKVVMIGDRKLDVLGAKENGIDSIGVLWGYGDLLELEKVGPTYIAEKVLDLLEIIK